MVDNIIELPSDKITDNELEYHQKILRESEQAQVMLAEAEKIAAKAMSKRAAAESWSEHLQEKYGLAIGDVVELDGTIIRTNKQ